MTREFHHRRGFTLVELLVVIGIIGVLAAISVPVVMQSLAKARNAAIKAEIDMLHMAIMSYKNQYGSFPPCFDADPARPVDSLTGNIAATAFAQKHLKRLFPRCANVSGGSGQFAGASTLTPANSIRGWLSGFTGNPTSPLQPNSNRTKMFDFDMARLDDNQAIYFPSGKPESPFIYVSHEQYGTPWPPSPVTYSVSGKTYTIASNTYQAQSVSGTYFNPDSFQILCAGRDGEFGDSSDDDLSNFWPGTRREYLDSLNN